MKACRFLILCYSLLKRRKMLIFAVLTFRKPASFYMQLMSRKVVPAQATHLPPCQKAISASWLLRLEMVDRIQNWWHFNLTQSTFYLNTICPFLIHSSLSQTKKVINNSEVLDSALHKITLYPPLFKLSNCKLQHATKLLMQQTRKITFQTYQLWKLSLSFWSEGETAYSICVHLFRTEPSFHQQLKKNLFQDTINNATRNNCLVQNFKYDIAAIK